MTQVGLKLMLLFLLLLSFRAFAQPTLPLVVTTWPFTDATFKAWEVINDSHSSSLDAVEKGCSICEDEQCDGSVGYGGSPDESGETTLDAMIMDGATMDVGSVANLRKIKNAVSVARAVMMYSKHTLIAGSQATDFAISMGFSESDLHTNTSVNMWKTWNKNQCQPNYRQNVTPDPKNNCGPYKPVHEIGTRSYKNRFNKDISRTNHDTIGMIVIDSNKNVASGTSTNGANHKVPGRVGDSPIVGAGSYADNSAGGAAATGDGDVMMRFLPSFHVVQLMKMGMSPTDAATTSIKEISRFYPQYKGAIVAASISGVYGAACHGFGTFHFSVHNPSMKNVTVEWTKCS